MSRTSSIAAAHKRGAKSAEARSYRSVLTAAPPQRGEPAGAPRTRGPGRAFVQALALLLVCVPATQASALTIISGLTVNERGDSTVIELRAAAKPMFSVFKLERPARLTIDVANGEFRGVPGLLDVDSWAVSQLATASFQTSAARIARLMINFRRPGHYTVATQGTNLVVTILPEQPRPKTDPVRLSRELQAAKQEASATATRLRQEAQEAKRLADERLQAVTAARTQAEKDRNQAEAARLLAQQRQKESAATAAQLEQERKQAADARQRAEAERKQATEAKAQAAAALAEAKRQTQALSEAQQRLSSREAQVQKLRAEMERAQKVAQDDAAGHRAAQAKMRKIEASLAEAVAQVKQAQTARTKTEAELRVAESRRQLAESARVSAESRRVATEEKLGAVAGKMQALEQQLSQAQTREVQQRKELGRLQSQADASRQAAKQAQAAYRTLANTVETERGRHKALLTEIARTKSELEQQKGVASAAVAKVDQLSRAVTEAKARLSRQTDESSRKVAAAELQKAEQRLRQAEVARQTAEQSRAKLLVDIRRRERQQQDTASALVSTERRLQEAKGRAKTAEQQLAGVEKRFKDAEGKRQQAEQARTSAEQRLTEVQSALSQARKARQTEEKALADLRREQEQAQTEVKRAQLAAKAKQGSRSKLPPATVRDIRYVDGEKTAQIHIMLDGSPAHRLSRDGRTPTLSLEGIVMPRMLQRTLDVSEFGGPLAQVTSYVPDPGSSSAVIKVSLREAGAPSRLRQQGDRLIWEFSKPALAKASPAMAGPGQAKPDEAVSFAAPRVAGVRVHRARQQQAFSGRRIDLDFKDADIHNILRLLSEVGNVNVVTADNVSGRVTIRMHNVPWDQALDVILRAKGLGQVREGNLVRVAPAADLEKERESEIARQKQVALLRPLETRLIPLSYAKAQGMLDKIRYALSPRGALTYDERTNMVIARDIGGNLDLMERMIRNLDTQTPQVLIEARIVEAQTAFSKEIGIQWGGFFNGSQATGSSTGLVFPSSIGIGGGATDNQTPVGGLVPTPTNPNPAFAVNLPASTGTGKGGALGLTLGSVSGNAAINLRLSAAETNGDIRIVSAPKVTTLDNVEAKIGQGTRIPYSQISAAGIMTAFIDAKLSLVVRPHVTADGAIIMRVEITKNEPDFSNTGANGQPSIITKEATTECLVKDGDTAVIGGIYTNRTSRKYSKVPWFADIPVLGFIFRSRLDTADRSEILVFITPRIVNRAQSLTGR
jgi:type IV pilus assembly protein PilQ